MVIKLDKKGNKLWQKIIGGSKDQVAKCGVITSDGGILVTGYTNEHLEEKNVDMLILKLTANGQ